MGDSRTYAFEGTRPTIDEQAYVSRDATLVGDVTVEADASVWPGVVLRGDIGPVHVGTQAHIGDNATVHASTIGDSVMVGHGAVLNEALIEERALVGFNSTVNTDATIGARSIVAEGTVIPDEYDIPAESFARGVPAETTPLEATTIDPDGVFEEFSSGAYTNLAERHEELFE